MDYIEIASGVSEVSKPLARVYSFFVVGCVIVGFYVPNSVPTSLLSSMHILLFFNTVGAAIFLYKYRKVPSISKKECPSCGSKMAYSEVKCLDENNKNCNLTLPIK